MGPFVRGQARLLRCQTLHLHQHRIDLTEADGAVGEVQTLAAELGNDLDQLRLRWLEARLDTAFGRRLAAIEKLRGVWAEFQRRRDCRSR